MRLEVLLLCFSLVACSSASESVRPAYFDLPPDAAVIQDGVASAVADSHFEPPIEVTDPIRANPNSSSPWLVCFRTGKSDESRRRTYSAFFADKYVSSRYSANQDPCAGQPITPSSRARGRERTALHDSTKAAGEPGIWGDSEIRCRPSLVRTMPPKTSFA
jgi:hypothetical protein